MNDVCPLSKGCRLLDFGKLRRGDLRPGGAKMGYARLMLPDRPLPVVSSVGFSPLHHGPNAAVAINAANLARGHVTFLSVKYRGPLRPRVPQGSSCWAQESSGAQPVRRALAQLFRDAQMPRSRRNRSHGTDEFMARIR
jgi:hypothetical protein